MTDFVLFPAIDLKGGQVVRLKGGNMEEATVFGDDPAEQARAFGNAGARWLHVVDLDGAFAGEARNRAAVEAAIAAFPGKVQVGGGIRSMADVESCFAAGATRIVLGTAALEDPELVRAAAKAHPGAIVVAVDARDGLVATRGWADVSNVPTSDLARRFEDAGVAALLFTDIGRDGLLKGVNVAATTMLADRVSIPIIASGGVSGLGDIKALLSAAGRTRGRIEGVVSGRAIYDGRLDLAEALRTIAGA